MIVVYMRVSSEEQREHQSIALQRIEMSAFCSAHKYENVEIIADDGISGTLALEDRPGGARLVALLASNKVERVLVWRGDRLGRDMGVLVNAIQLIERSGVVLESKLEGVLSLTDPGRILMTAVQAGLAVAERANIRQRVKTRGMQLAKEGTWLGGQVPFGYDKVGMGKDSRLAVNPEQADVVKRIYRLASTGKSNPKIAEELNRLGLKASDGQPWNAGCIRVLIASATYRGEHFYGKRTTVVEGGKRRLRTLPRDRWLSRLCPAIVTPALWAKANAEMHRNQIVAMTHSKNDYLLRGLIRCGCCGLNYLGTAVTGTDRTYYRCNGSKSERGVYGKKGERCPNKSLVGRELEELVLMDLKRYASKPGEAIRELQKSLALRDEERPIADEIAAMDKWLASRADARNRVLEMYQDGTISKPELTERLMRINTEATELEKQLSTLRTKARDTQTNVRQLQSVETMLHAIQKLLQGNPTFETRRRVVEALVKEIIVWPIPKNTWSRVPGSPSRIQSSCVAGTPIKDGEETEPYVTIKYVFPTPAERRENSLPHSYAGSRATR